MKILKSLILCLGITLGVSSSAIAAPVSQELLNIHYVRVGGTGNCSDWTNSCELQTALANANSGDQIWVAAGTYFPTTTYTGRDASFQLRTGVIILGGFPSAGGDMVSRDSMTHSTILSGDIGAKGVVTDNSFHVVTAIGAAETSLDGFSITGGSARDFGGGIYLLNSSPNLNNLTITANSAFQSGGGMYTESSSPYLTNVTFSGNSANSGGGVYNYQNSAPILTNVTFSENSANWGGGMYNCYSNPTLINVTFYKNKATRFGGGMNNYWSGWTMDNAIFWGNTPDQIERDAQSVGTISYSIIQGGYDWGTNIIDADPLLSPLADSGGFTLTHALSAGSPAIDAGNPVVSTDTDQRGFPRPLDGDNDGTAIGDIGAYEYKYEPNIYLPMIIN